MMQTLPVRAASALVATAITICLPGAVPVAPRFGADALVGAPTAAKSASVPSAYSATSFPLVHLGATAKRCNYIVGYQVNESAMSAAGATGVATRATVLAVIKAAVADLSSRTGQPYRYDGPTTFSPTSANFSTGPDDLVIVVKGSANNDFYMAAAPGTYLAGMTRWLLGGAGTSVVEISPVMIDLRTAASRANLYATVQHELAHSVGLSHSKRAADVMFAQLNTATPAVYSTADTAALAASSCRS